MSRDSTSWSEVSLGEICEFKYGKSLPEDKRSGGDIPVYGSNGVVGRHNEPITDGPAIVVGRKGSFGEVHLSPTACWPIDTTYFIDSSATKADLKWLAYRLTGLGLTKLNKAAAVPGLNREDAYRQKLMLPPLAEQRRIAEALDRAEALRAKRRAALAQFDTLAQAIFLDLFGDPTTNPKQFRVSRFSDACDRIFKGAFDLKAASYRGDGIPFIRIANIRNGTIDLANAVYVDEQTHKEYQGSELLPGDLVFSKVGTIDRIGVIPQNIRRCIISQNNVGAKLRHELALPTFALSNLTTPYALGKIRAGSKKAVQDKLVLEELRNLPFMLPPIKLQREFARRVGAVEKLKTAQSASLAELDALFDSLQHRAFRGEL